MYLIFDTETTGLPKKFNAPITDLDNWPRLVQLAYLVYDFDGNLIREVKLPGVGSSAGFGGKLDAKELYFSFTNYTTPATIYSFNPKDGKASVYKKPVVDFKSENYISTQVFYTSKDGTKIPMIITHKKGLKINGKNPTILYGYGGFIISSTPSFSASLIPWLEKGGIYVVEDVADIDAHRSMFESMDPTKNIKIYIGSHI